MFGTTYYLVVGCHVATMREIPHELVATKGFMRQHPFHGVCNRDSLIILAAVVVVVVVAADASRHFKGRKTASYAVSRQTNKGQASQGRRLRSASLSLCVVSLVLGSLYELHRTSGM